MDNTSGLVQELVRRQGQEPGATFGERLGLSKAGWNYVRQGRRRLGAAALGRIAHAYPELQGAILGYLWHRNDE